MNKFWKLYRKMFPIEIIVGLWFITPVLTLFFTNSLGLVLAMEILVVAVSLVLENGYNNYIRSK